MMNTPKTSTKNHQDFVGFSELKSKFDGVLKSMIQFHVCP